MGNKDRSSGAGEPVFLPRSLSEGFFPGIPGPHLATGTDPARALLDPDGKRQSGGSSVEGDGSLANGVRSGRGITAAILAGGKSSRMGRDKSCLPVAGGDLSFLEHLHFVCASVFPRVIVMSGRPAEGPPRFRFCQDLSEGLGPVGGILSAYDHCGTDSLFVCACDMPGLTPEAFSFFLDRMDPERISVAMVEGKMEPLFSFFPRTAESALRRYVGEGRRPVRGFVLDQPHCPVVFPDSYRDCFRNINTPREYAIYRGRGVREEPVAFCSPRVQRNL